MTKEEILNTFSVGDYIQVAATEVPGVPGKLIDVYENSIVIGPYDDEDMIEYYGDPTSAITIIPMDTITLLFKLNPDIDE